MNYVETYTPDSDPGKKSLPYVKKGKFSLLFLSVLVFHIFLVVLPFFVLQLSNLINPPLAVEHVTLVDSPPNDNDIPTPFPSPDRPVNDGIPPKGEEAPAALPDLADVPVLPDLPEVKQPEMKQEVKQPEVKQPEVKQPEVKQPEVKPEIPVPVKEEKIVKKPVKKPIEKKEVTKTKYVSPKDIKISTKKVKRTPSAASPVKNPGKSAAELRAERIRNLLNAYRKNQGKNSSSGSPYGRDGARGKAGGAGGPKGVTSREMKGYYEQVRNFLMRSWQQPNTALLNNTRPEVLVLISVDASGRITSAKILRRSGNNAMDTSVETLLKAVKVLPKPPRAMQFTVNVNIE